MRKELEEALEYIGLTEKYAKVIAITDKAKRHEAAEKLRFAVRQYVFSEPYDADQDKGQAAADILFAETREMCKEGWENRVHDLSNKKVPWMYAAEGWFD